MKIIARYRTDTEEIVISQYPNGLYYIHYGWMENHNCGACVAGRFDSLEEAKKMLMKHRPNVKERV